MKRNLVILAAALTIFTLLLSACGSGGSSAQVTEAPAAQATEAPIQAQPESSASAFYLQVAKIVGTVEVRANANEDFAPAEVGQRLIEGAEIRTGTDGIIALYRDALSMVIVDNNSELHIKTLQGSKEAPVTVLFLVGGGAVIEHHSEKLPEGAVFQIDTPDGNNGAILGSTVRVGYDPETKIMTATCLTGTCTFVRGDQTLTLQEGQAVDIQGLQPPPGAPSEMTVEQANQFLAMGGQLCGCVITIGEIRDGGLSQTAPAPEDIAEEKPEDNSNTDSGGGDSSGGDSGGGDSGGGDSGGNP